MTKIDCQFTINFTSLQNITFNLWSITVIYNNLQLIILIYSDLHSITIIYNQLRYEAWQIPPDNMDGKCVPISTDRNCTLIDGKWPERFNACRKKASVIGHIIHVLVLPPLGNKNTNNSCFFVWGIKSESVQMIKPRIVRIKKSESYG